MQVRKVETIIILILVQRLKIIQDPAAESGVGWRPTWGTCETSQVLLVGVPGGFSWSSPIFAPPTD